MEQSCLPQQSPVLGSPAMPSSLPVSLLLRWTGSHGLLQVHRCCQLLDCSETEPNPWDAEQGTHKTSAMPGAKLPPKIISTLAVLIALCSDGFRGSLLRWRRREEQRRGHRVHRQPRPGQRGEARRGGACEKGVRDACCVMDLRSVRCTVTTHLGDALLSPNLKFDFIFSFNHTAVRCDGGREITRQPK